MRRSDHRVAAAWNVAAHAIDRYIPLAQTHAGYRLELEIKEREILDTEFRSPHQNSQDSSEHFGSGHTPESDSADRFLSDEVLKALERVPVDFRLVVVLSDIYGYSYKEIARRVDIPIGTVMSRLFRGRRLLQEQLYDYAVKEGVIRLAQRPSEEHDAFVCLAEEPSAQAAA